mmetsp:Transcript_81012/g.156441  ORF Transcript_81012/g.156441 Transcript_81012/m.156441 type:complete len:129 (+) Transcript_81012:10-396(+)
MRIPSGSSGVSMLHRLPLLLPRLDHGFLCLTEVVRVFLEGGLDKLSLFPEVRSQVPVGCTQRLKSGLHEVLSCPGVTTRASKAIGDACKRQHLLHHRRPHNARATGRWYEAHTNRAAFAVDLHWSCVR